MKHIQHKVIRKLGSPLLWSQIRSPVRTTVQSDYQHKVSALKLNWMANNNTANKTHLLLFNSKATLASSFLNTFYVEMQSRCLIVESVHTWVNIITHTLTTSHMHTHRHDPQMTGRQIRQRWHSERLVVTCMEFPTGTSTSPSLNIRRFRCSGAWLSAVPIIIPLPVAVIISSALLVTVRAGSKRGLSVHVFISVWKNLASHLLLSHELWLSHLLCET